MPTYATGDLQLQASGRTSDMFSLVGTVFLWMFWPSFNAAAAAAGAPQHRAVLNTYFSLCACVLASFAISAATHEKQKFVMVKKHASYSHATRNESL